MKERPILFSAPMVRALLAGTKTQTRRIVVPGRTQNWLRPELLARSPRAKPALSYGVQWAQFAHPLAWKTVDGITHDEWSPLTCVRCPYGKPGDQLWVREAWRTVIHADALLPRDLSPAHRIWYEAQAEVPPPPSEAGKLRPSMFMPRWASRITLEITGIRVERLQDISVSDALAEGITHRTMNDPRVEYQHLWEDINGAGSWDLNPWVWVVEFKRVEGGAA